MPAEKTRADSLREYLTGAGSDGGAQADPDASLGNYRSSTLAESMDVVVTNAISGITIDFVGGGNAVGDGDLDVVDSNTLQWRDFGGTYGPTVSIANGETKILEASGDPGAYIRVSRTSAAALTGTATLTLTRSQNNVFALDDVSSAEAASGDTEYRATILVNESSGTVNNLKRWIGTLGTSQISDVADLASSGAGTIETTGTFADWPESGWCHIKNGSSTREIVYYSERTDTVLTVPSDGRAQLGTTAAAGAATDTIHAVPPVSIGTDPDGVTAGGAAIQTIANESTLPSSVTWSTGITADTGLDIGDMTTGQQIGLWIARMIPPNAVAAVDVTVLLEDSFDAA